MRSLTTIVTALSFLLVTACGQIGPRPMQDKMTEAEAMDVLAQVAANDVAVADPEAPTTQGLADVLQDMIDSGELQVPQSARGAIGSNGAVDMSQLSNILNMIGQGMSAFQIAKGVVANSGNTTAAKFNLDTIVALLQAALPIITTIAPQYAGVIQAVLVIVPIIKTFIGLFKKPTASILKGEVFA
jgi:hypothetical protein